MTLQAAFFVIDHLAIYSVMVLALCLLLTNPRSSASWVAVLIGSSTAAYVYFSRVMFSGWIPEPYQFPDVEWVITGIRFLMNTIPAAFMVLTFLLFEDTRQKFPKVLIGLLLVQISLEDFLPFVFGVTTRPTIDVPMTDTSAGLYLVFEVLPALLQATFVALALFWTLKDWRDDLVSPRRRVRLFMVVFIGVNLVSYTLLTRLLLNPNDITILYVHEGYQVLNAVLNTGVLVFLLITPDHETKVLAEDPRPVQDPESLDPDFQRFEAAMASGLYRETGLSIASLAAHIQVPEYRLRKLINQRLGYRNFNQMLNRYRIDDVAEALADPAQRHLPILTIALSVGYQSINPFNRAFRELKGTTPSAYRQQFAEKAGEDAGKNST